MILAFQKVSTNSFSNLEFTLKEREIGMITEGKLGREILRLCVNIGKTSSGNIVTPLNRFEIGFATRMEGHIANLSIWENIKLPVSYHDLDISDDYLGNILEELGIPSSLWQQRPSELDPEHRKRLLLARSIATKPKLLLLDEPSHQIPWIKTPFLISWIKKRQDEGMGILISTTNLPLAASLGDWALDSTNFSMSPIESILPEDAFHAANIWTNTNKRISV